MQETIEEIASEGGFAFICLDGGVSFEIDSPDYEQVKHLKVVDYRITENTIGSKTLHIITKERPDLKRESDLSPLQKEKLDQVISEKISVVIFHKTTYEMTGKEVEVRHIPAYVQAVIENYRRSHPDCKAEDFAVVRVNFATKNIQVQPLQEA